MRTSLHSNGISIGFICYGIAALAFCCWPLLLISLARAAQGAHLVVASAGDSRLGCGARRRFAVRRAVPPVVWSGRSCCAAAPGCIVLLGCAWREALQAAVRVVHVAWIGWALTADRCAVPGSTSDCMADPTLAAVPRRARRARCWG